MILGAILSGLTLDANAAVAAERHVVTASGSRWLYRGQSSGKGIDNALRIYAALGDTIEFRRSDGDHNVFFYLSRPEDSELGLSVNVDENFEVLTAPLTELSSRLFPKTALTTQFRTRGKDHLTTIRIRGDFKRPIYFGSTTLSTYNGRFMHGVILPLAFKATPSHKMLPSDFDVRRVKGLRIFSRMIKGGWRLGRLSKSSDAVEVFRNKGIFRVPDNGGPTVNVTDQWFETVPEVDPRRHPWYNATSIDLDNDYDFDLVAAVGTAEGGQWQWWKLISNASVEGLADDEIRFTAAELLSHEKYSKDQASHSLSAAVDVNNDGRTDLILYNGKRGEPLKIYLNRGKTLRLSGSRIDFTSLVDDSDPYLITSSDINFDGWNDLVVATPGRDAVVFFNDATGGFPVSLAMPLPDSRGRIDKVALADVDGDGIPDLVVQIADGPTRVYYKDGN
ncbi:VCBS repeat-containing protein [Nitrospinae bacterium AH_259_B05_G02_I21]|nr:VCBS repeat-containing protein [Nitrospinae bacterium AH_259_B05_G02_I21]